jgi:hypothetical protein
MEDVIFIESGFKRKGVVVKCKACNKEFITRKNKPKKCCSPECGQKRRRIRFEVECKNCGNKCEKNLSQLSNSKSKFYFCCRECKDQAQRIGGVQEIMPPHYGTSQGREKCKKLLNKKNACCCDCGDKRRYLLCVHHIDRNRENNSLENLEVVCGSCHMKRHLAFNEKKNRWVYRPKFITPRDKLADL